MSDVPKKETGHDTYSILFIVFSDRVERWLIRIGVLLLLLFLLSQMLLRIPLVRHAVTKVEQLEGVRVSLPATEDQHP